jgi:hypothetical protein
MADPDINVRVHLNTDWNEAIGGLQEVRQALIIMFMELQRSVDKNMGDAINRLEQLRDYRIPEIERSAQEVAEKAMRDALFGKTE